MTRYSDDSARARSGTSAGRIVRQSRRSRSSGHAAEHGWLRRRAALVERLRRRVGGAEGERDRRAAPPWAARRRRPGSVVSISAAPSAAACVTGGSRPRAGARARRADAACSGSVRSAQRGNGLQRGPRLVGVERRLQRGDRELVDAERAVERVLLASRSMAPARPTTMPAWGPPSSLSPEKDTRSTPEPTTSGTVGSYGKP